METFPLKVEGQMKTMNTYPDYTATSDAQLLSLVATGSRDAIDQLYDRHAKKCYVKALSIIADPSDAEEIVQDIFLKLWTLSGGYISGRGEFNGWLMTMVRNQAIDRLRHKKRSISATALTYDISDPFDTEEMRGMTPVYRLSDGVNTPYEEAWRREQSSAVSMALGLLPAPQRDAIRLAYFGGLSQAEVSRKLGVPLGTIKTRTQRGLLKLRGLLDSYRLTYDAA